MKKNCRIFITWVSLSIFLAATGLADAQSLTVSGTVTADGQPLPGATVLEKGTQNGTSTDIDGQFSLRVSNPNAILQINYLGYMPYEVPVNNRSQFDIELSEDPQALEEVVVVGYGTIPKREVTGAVVQLKGKQLGNVPVPSFEHGLQSLASGVQVTQTSAAPGGGVSVRIRGGNSIIGGNEPLYVIDGFPIYPNNNGSAPSGSGRPGQSLNILSTLNPSDIESVEILKDASATAIYGARGANGVVLVTTKRGKQGGVPRVSYEGYAGVQQVAKRLDLVDAESFATLVNDAFINEGQSPVFVSDDPNSLFARPDLQGQGTDWQEEVFRSAPIQSHQLNIAGGSNRVAYAMSGSYFSQEGVVKGAGFQRGTFRTNLDAQISKRFSAGANIFYSYTFQNPPQSESRGGSSSGLMNGVVAMPPVVPIFQPDGTYTIGNPVPNGTTTNNPVATAILTQDELIARRLLGTVFVSAEIVDGVTFRSSFGTDLLNADRDIYHPKQTLVGASANGRAAQSTRDVTSWLNENTLTYTLKSGAHRLNLLAAYTRQQQVNESRLIEVFDFANEQTGADNLLAGAAPQPPITTKSKWSLASWVGRAHYIWQEKYLLTLTGRADGSSRFGANNRWAFFPSAALAWQMSDEAFLQNSETISDLKLRLSYGLTGNQEIPPYLSQAGLVSANYVFDGNLVTGVKADRLANPDLRWETTSMFNLGLDAAFSEGRFSFSIDAYRNITEDLLLEVTLPSGTGFTSVVKNTGRLENKGIEWMAEGLLLDKSNATWRMSANFSLNRNQILDLGDSEPFYAPQYSLHLKTRGSWVAPGYPVGIWRELEHDGVFQNQAQLDAEPNRPGDVVGNLRFVDQNGDGEIDATDRTVVGDPNPDFIYGMTQDVQVGKLGFHLLLQGVQGADIRNVNRTEIASVGPYANQLTDMLDYWRLSNTETQVPRPSLLNNGTEEQSSWQIEDGSFLRLRSVTLDYTLENQFGFESLRLYLTGQNLLTFSSYGGYDPEVNSAGQNNLNLGYDYNAFPRARTYLAGLQVVF